jgi:hypothetical protein
MALHSPRCEPIIFSYQSPRGTKQDVEGEKVISLYKHLAVPKWFQPTVSEPQILL